MSKVQVTKNNTLVLDAEVENAPMVVVYRGLGPEVDSDHAYDTSEWMLEQIKEALSDDLLKKIIFVVPDDYTVDLEHAIQQATALIKGKVTTYSLCGFSQGGVPLYKNLRKRPWKIVGLIDPVSPSMVWVSKDKRMENDVVDPYAKSIRCIYGVSHWGTEPAEGKDPKAYTKKERGYTTIKDFYDHLTDLGVKMIDAGKKRHPEMPEAFFEEYGSDFI